MKSNHTEQNRKNAESGTTFKNTCLTSCQKVLARITSVKEAIFHESFAALKTREHLLRLALNEAEAAAWQTNYPHLFFPALAAEKVQAVANWNARQQSMRENRPVIALAA